MLYILIVVAIVLTEMKIKNYIEEHKKIGERKEILGGRIILKKQYNYGMMMNLLDDKKELVKTVSCVILGLFLLLFALVLPRKGNKLFKLGLSLCLGGAISNVHDRVSRGYVIDYFSFNCKKLKKIVFNLADMAIFLGCALMLLSSFFSMKGQSGTNETLE